ncbi:MAG: SDR family oxidoreductase [Hyphomicrobiaceae bacterium]
MSSVGPDSANERSTKDVVSPPSLRNAKVVLLTGATGFVGGFILKELLDQTDARVVCLARGHMIGRSALGRVREKAIEVGIDLEVFDQRVSVVPGNIDKDKFGLADPAYDALALQVDAVFHLAARLNYVASAESLMRANTESVRRVLRFCRDAGDATLHYVSTSGVFMSLEALELGYLSRDVPLELYKSHPIGYFGSKWAAELLVREARANGLPALIYRPSFVGGTLDSGYLPPRDLTRTYLEACLEVRAMPDIDFVIDIIPVDTVAKAVVSVAVMSDRPRLDWNICNPSPGVLARLARTVPAIGYRLQAVDYAEWCALLHKGAPSFAKNLMKFVTRRAPDMPGGLIAYFAQVPAAPAHLIDTNEALAPLGLTCPPADTMMLQSYLGHVSGAQEVSAAM